MKIRRESSLELFDCFTASISTVVEPYRPYPETQNHATREVSRFLVVEMLEVEE